MKMEFRDMNDKATRFTVSRDDYFNSYDYMYQYLGTWCEEVLRQITKKEHSCDWYDNEVDEMLDHIISHFIHPAFHTAQDDTVRIVKRYKALYFQYSGGEVRVMKYLNV